MPISVFDASVPVFKRMLGNCNDILAKAAAHAEAHGIDPADLLRARLRPDMFSLARQVEIAADGARGTVARLAGVEPEPADEPRYAVFNRGGIVGFGPEAESLTALMAYTAAAIAAIGTFEPHRFDGAGERTIRVTMDGQTRVFAALPFLFDYALPNFHFHIAMAYANLRHCGVELGKRDYEGAPVYTRV